MSDYIAPELDDLFMPILNVLDQKKTFTDKQLKEELLREFSHVTEETLMPNLDFCIKKLEDAELIEKLNNFYRLTPKGRKIILSDTNELGLKEVNFYAAHGADFFGLPPGGLKLKTFINKHGDVNFQKWAIAIAAVCVAIGVGYYVSKVQDNGSTLIWDETFKSLENDKNLKQFDQTMDKTIQDLKR